MSTSTNNSIGAGSNDAAVPPSSSVFNLPVLSGFMARRAAAARKPEDGKGDESPAGTGGTGPGGLKIFTLRRSRSDAGLAHNDLGVTPRSKGKRTVSISASPAPPSSDAFAEERARQEASREHSLEPPSSQTTVIPDDEPSAFMVTNPAEIESTLRLQSKKTGKPESAAVAATRAGSNVLRLGGHICGLLESAASLTTSLEMETQERKAEYVRIRATIQGVAKVVDEVKANAAGPRVALSAGDADSGNEDIVRNFEERVSSAENQVLKSGGRMDEVMARIRQLENRDVERAGEVVSLQKWMVDNLNEIVAEVEKELKEIRELSVSAQQVAQAAWDTADETKIKAAEGREDVKGVMDRVHELMQVSVSTPQVVGLSRSQTGTPGSTNGAVRSIDNRPTSAPVVRTIDNRGVKRLGESLESSALKRIHTTPKKASDFLFHAHLTPIPAMPSGEDAVSMMHRLFDDVIPGQSKDCWADVNNGRLRLSFRTDDLAKKFTEKWNNTNRGLYQEIIALYGIETGRASNGVGSNWILDGLRNRASSSRGF